MGWLTDDWDPLGWDINNNGLHTLYGLRDNNDGTFSLGGVGEDQFVIYNNVEGDSPDILSIAWNKATQDVYYKPKNSDKFYQLNTQGIEDATDKGGWLFGTHYLSDRQLNTFARHASNSIKQIKSEEALKQAETDLDNTMNTKLAGVPTLNAVKIPTKNIPDEAQEREYANRKAEADKLLQNMLQQHAATQLAEKDNTVYYKYGANDIDLKYYLHNLGTNLQGYMDSKNWNQSQRDAFMNAYNNYKSGLTDLLNGLIQRFSTDESGRITDSGNLLTANDTVYYDSNGNVYNSLDEISNKKQRNSAQAFSANQEVQDYLNTVGQAIVSAGKVRTPESSTLTDFDLTNNGFENYFFGKINPNGGQYDIDPYLALDPVNPKGKRERTNRIKYLVSELNNYANQIKASNTYTFDKTPFKTKDAYLLKIQDTINNLNNGWDATDVANLQAIGISPEFYTKFLSEDAKPLMSAEELSAEQLKQKSEAESKYIEDLSKVYNEYASKAGTYTNNNKLSYVQDRHFGAEGQGKRNAEFELKKMNYDMSEASSTASFYAAWQATLTALRIGATQVNTPSGPKPISKMLQILFPIIQDAFKDSGSGVKYYDDPERDGKYGAILCYKDGKFYFDFIENVKESTAWQNKKNEFNAAYVGTETSDKPKHSFNKLGGILRKLQEGGNLEKLSEEDLAMLEQLSTQSEQSPLVGDSNQRALLLFKDASDSVYGERRAKAEARGMSYDRYNAKQRTLNGTPDLYNDDNGVWKQEDWIRMGTVLADITSLVLDPVSGGVLNVGSTLGNLAADYNDNTVTMSETFKNFAANVGMDLLSIIPIVGDAAGTGTKLLKSARKIAPKLLYGLSVYGTLATIKNGDNIKESLGKLMSSDKLTVGDWQNIAQAISALAGANGLAKGHMAKRLAKNNARVDDAIGIGLRKKNADGSYSEAQDYIFRGEKAKLLKEAISSGKIDDVNAKIKGIAGFENFEINTSLKTIPVSTRLPIGRTKTADGKTTWDVRKPYEIQRQMDTFEIFDKSKLREGWASKTHLNTNRQDAVLATNQYDASNITTKADLATKIEADVRATPEFQRAETATKRRQDALTRIDNSLNGTKDAKGNITAKGKVELLKEAKADLDKAKTKNSKLLKDLDTIRTERSKTVTANGKSYTAQQIDAKFAELSKHEANIARLEQISKPTSSDRAKLIAARVERDKLQTELEALKDWNDKYGKSKYDQAVKDAKASNKAEKDLAHILASYDADIANLKEAQSKMLKDSQNFEASRATRDLELYMRQFHDYEFAPGRRTDLTTEVNDIFKRMNLLKKGGRLKFLKTGDTVDLTNRDRVANVTYKKDPSWLDDYIYHNGTISDNAAEVYRNINKDNFKKYNELQDSYRTVFAAGTPNPKSGYEGMLPKDPNAQKHQLFFNEWAHPLNIRFGKMVEPFGRVRGANTTDKEEGGFVDQRPGSMTYLRHLGNEQSHVDLINNSGWLGEGVEAYWDDVKNMVKFKPKTADDAPVKNTILDNSVINSPEPQLGDKDYNLISLPKTNTSTGNKNNPATKDKSTTGLKDKVSLGTMAPELLSALRLWKLNSANAKITANALKKQPFYQTPVVNHEMVRSDLQEEAQGLRNLGKVVRPFAAHAATSDSAQQIGAMMDAWSKGTEIANQSFAKSTQMYRDTTKRARDLAMENNKVAWQIGNQNGLGAVTQQHNNINVENQGKLQHTTNIDTALQGMQHNIQQKNAQREALEREAAQAKITNAVKYNPNDYGANLSQAELDLYLKAVNGSISSADLTADLIAMLNSANSKVTEAAQNQWLSYNGIDLSRFNVKRNTPIKPQYKVQLSTYAKDGTKLKIAKMRERVKNADRFQKSILKQLDNIDRKLARVSKSMYGLPKSEVIK